MANLRPHTFEGDVQNGPYCLVCQLPFSNRIHTVRNRRTRVALSIDHPVELSYEDVLTTIVALFESEPRLMLVDTKEIP